MTLNADEPTIDGNGNPLPDDAPQQAEDEAIRDEHTEDGDES